MGKKDAHVTNLPVDQYRKQIGKQDWQKSKKDIKSAKSRSGTFEDQQLKIGDVALIALVILLILVAIYLGLFWYLNEESLITVV